MQRILRPVFIAVIATAAAACAALAADTAPARADRGRWEKAQANYIAALREGNPGAKMCAARLVADYRLKGSVAELMELLRHDPSENVRISAALALIVLDEKDGREAVAEASLYDGSDRVARFCQALIEAHPATSPAIAGD